MLIKQVRPFLIALGLLLAACAPAPPPATPTPETPAGPGRLRVDFPEDPDAADIPWVLGLEMMEAEGYEIERLTFAETSLPIAALAQGDLDLASLSNLGSWAAIRDGAPMVTIMDVSAIALAVIAAPEIQQCADLDGKGLAIAGVNTVSGKMVQNYIEQNCPGTAPEVLAISGSSNRRAGLLAGELAAALLNLDDLLDLQKDEQAGYHILFSLPVEFPGLTISSVLTRRELAEAYPDAVRDFIRTQLEARRQMQAPAVLQAELEKRLEYDSATAQETMELYLAQRIWDLNGGYTLDAVQNNLDFLIGLGELPDGTRAEDVADLSYLNAVLDKIGRQ